MKNRTLHESTRGRAFLISILGGLTLLALAVTVFAVASQARSVSTQAERSVNITENLRGVTTARAQLSIASRVSQFNSVQTEVIATSIAEAESALDAVEFDEQTSDNVRTVFAEYRRVAGAQAELIEAGTSSAAEAEVAEAATGQAFEALAEVLRVEQVAARDRLVADNDLMNVISTIATFVVAFVVPSAALYIFEALRRTPRQARALELEYENSSATSLAMAAAVAKEAGHLRGILDGLPEATNSDELRRSVLRFEHVAALNGAVRTLHNVDIAVDELAMDVTRGIGQVVAIDTSNADDPVVHGDRDQITLVIFELVHNAITHGSMPIQLVVSTDVDSVHITVTDRGPGLPDVVEDAIIHDNEYATRGNLLSGAYGFGLLAAREATESLGGRLRYHRDTGETSLIVELPRRQVDGERKPIEISLPAALEGRSAA